MIMTVMSMIFLTTGKKNHMYDWLFIGLFE